MHQNPEGIWHACFSQDAPLDASDLLVAPNHINCHAFSDAGEWSTKLYLRVTMSWCLMHMFATGISWIL